jgi:hypothetical protein
MFDPSAVDRSPICYFNLVTDTDMNGSESNVDESNPSRTLYPPNNEDDVLIDDYYMHFKEKFRRIKLQFPANLEISNVLWSIDTTSPLHIGYLPHLLSLNILNRSNKTFIIISSISELSEYDTKIESFCEILSHFKIIMSIVFKLLLQSFSIPIR